jgi:hypothetical protein
MAINRGWTACTVSAPLPLASERGWSTVLRPALWFLW